VTVSDDFLKYPEKMDKSMCRSALFHSGLVEASESSLWLCPDDHLTATARKAPLSQVQFSIIIRHVIDPHFFFSFYIIAKTHTATHMRLRLCSVHVTSSMLSARLLAS
jgi:hypothetical protein